MHELHIVHLFLPSLVYSPAKNWMAAVPDLDHYSRFYLSRGWCPEKVSGDAQRLWTEINLVAPGDRDTSPRHLCSTMAAASLSAAPAADMNADFSHNVGQLDDEPCSPSRESNNAATLAVWRGTWHPGWHGARHPY